MNGYGITPQMSYQYPVQNPVTAASLSTGITAPVVPLPQMTPAQAQSAVTPQNVTPGVTAPVTGAGGVTDATGEAAPGMWDKLGGMKGIASLMEGLASIGSIYTGLQSIKLAKQEHKLSKEAYRTNLANTRMSYNTQLEDRARSRFATEGQSQEAADSYVQKHRV